MPFWPDKIFLHRGCGNDPTFQHISAIGTWSKVIEIHQICSFKLKYLASNFFHYIVQRVFHTLKKCQITFFLSECLVKASGDFQRNFCVQKALTTFQTRNPFSSLWGQGQFRGGQIFQCIQLILTKSQISNPFFPTQIFGGKAVSVSCERGDCRRPCEALPPCRITHLFLAKKEV